MIFLIASSAENARKSGLGVDTEALSTAPEFQKTNVIKDFKSETRSDSSIEESESEEKTFPTWTHR